MNVKHLAKFAGSAVSAGAAARTFSKARRQNDRLRMLDAVISVVSIAITIAIVLREIREDRDSNSRVIDIEDHT